MLVYNPAGVIDLSGITGGVATTDVTSLTGVTLTDYSALYIESPSGCCEADNTVLNGFGAAVSAFIASGGNFSIENYVGGDYDGVVPGGLGHLFGDGSIVGGNDTTCSDGERVNATGMAKGFTQPAVDACWSHQGYESSYWLPLGYISLMDSATDATDAASGGWNSGGITYGDGTQIGSSFLAFGGTLGAPVPTPEPISLTLFGAGLIGAAAIRRRKAAKKA